MSFNGVKKSNPRLSAKEVYSYIASQTSLTIDQARECFTAYAKMLEDIATNKYTDKSLTIPLPHVGDFNFSRYKGRKSGSTYKFFKEPKEEGYKTVVIEEDEPSFYYIKLRVARKLHNSIRKHTEFYE